MSAQVRLGWQLEAEIAEKMAPVMYAVSIIGEDFISGDKRPDGGNEGGT